MNEADFRNYLGATCEEDLPESHVRALVAALDSVCRFILWKEVADQDLLPYHALSNILFQQVGDWEVAKKLMGHIVTLAETRIASGGPCTGEDFLFEEHTTKSRAIFAALAAKGAAREEIHQTLAKRLTHEMKAALCELSGSESDGAMVHVFAFHTEINNNSGAAGVRVIRLLVESLK